MKLDEGDYINHPLYQVLQKKIEGMVKDDLTSPEVMCKNFSSQVGSDYKLVSSNKYVP